MSENFLDDVPDEFLPEAEGETGNIWPDEDDPTAAGTELNDLEDRDLP